MKKSVECPQCGSRIMDAEENVSTQTKIVKPNDPELSFNRWPPDYYIKCWKCKARIALRKIENRTA